MANIFQLNNPNLQTQNPDLSALIPLDTQMSAPQGFAAHIANPANLQAIAPALADRPTINANAPKAPNLFDAKSNWFAGNHAPIIQPRINEQALADAAPAPANIAPPTLATSPNLPAPQAPAAQGQTQVDENKLRDLQASGAGLNKIQNPFLRGLARVGDIAGTILAPGVAAALPGTTLHNRVLQSQQQGIVARDQQADQIAQQNATNQANLSHTQAETANIPVLASIKQGQLDQAYAKIGYRPSLDANGNQTGQYEVDPQSPAYLKQQAQEAAANSLVELRNAQADLDRSKNDPDSPAYKLALGRYQVALRNANTAAGNLSQRQNENSIKFYGVDSQGNIPAGQMLLPDGTPVGTANAANVRPTSGQRDAAGRADTLMSLDARIRKQLDDPEIQSYLGPANGRLAEYQGKFGTLPPKVAELRNDLVSYGAFQAGLHPVRGIGALQYFDKVMGGLGQDPGELIGKLNSNAATAAAVQNVGKPKVSGGSGALNAPAPGSTPKVRKFNRATGRLE